MSRSVTFAGVTSYRPGGITRINAEGLAQVSLFSNGIVGLIGEADGGPNGVVTIDDPALAKSTFTSGPLADAIRLAFQPSADPRIPGGAFRVLAVKVNTGTQSGLTLYSKVLADTASGSVGTTINLVTGGLTSNAHVGNKLRVGTEEREILSNTVSAVVVDAVFSTNPLPAGTVVTFLAPQINLTSIDYGVHTTRIGQEFEAGSSRGSSWTTIFDGKPQSGDNLGGLSYLDVEYIGQSAKVMLDTGTTDGAGLINQIADSTKSWTTNAFQNLFVYVTGGALGVANLRKISTNSAIQINVTNNFTAIPGIGASYEVVKSAIWTGTVVSAATSSITIAATINVALNEFANLVLSIYDGTGKGQRRTITSNTAGISSVITVDEAWTTIPDATSKYKVQYVTQATGTISGTLGKANKFRTTVAVNGAIAAQDLDIDFFQGMTILDIVNLINANADYRAYVPNGINSKILMNTFDFDAGAVNVELRNDKGTDTVALFPPTDPQATWLNHFRRDLQIIVDDINNRNQYVTAERVAGTSYGAGTGKPEYTGGAITIAGDVFKYLTGGTRGSSDNTDWQEAFDLLATNRVNHVVPLISQDLTNEGYNSNATFASVAAIFANFIDFCAGAGKNECGGYMGMKGTKTQFLAQANALNEPDLAMSSQRIYQLDVNSNLKWFDEWGFAVIAAGMRAGASEVGEPLTHKYIKIYDITQDTSWDPNSITDANQLIENGFLFAETVKGKGTRIVRDLTTYVTDDNLAYSEGSVRDAVRYVAFGLRTYIEDRFTGRKGTPATAESIKIVGGEFLEIARSNNIIVDSTDETGNTIYAYHNMRVKISGDVATIRVGIFPVVGINFQFNDIYLSISQQNS